VEENLQGRGRAQTEESLPEKEDSVRTLQKDRLDGSVAKEEGKKTSVALGKKRGVDSMRMLKK